jgi:O-antigen/teichoic acid export membrane protein
LNLVGTAVTAVLVFLQSVVVSRGVSTDEAGLFFSVTSAAVILTTVAVFGADASLPRFIPLLRNQDRPRAAESVIRIASAIAVGVSLLLGIVLVVDPSSVAPVLGLGIAPSQSERILWLVVVCLPFAATAIVWVAATRAYMTIRPTVLVEKIGKSALQILCLLWAITAGYSAAGLVGAWLLPTAAVALPAYLWLARIARRSREGTPGADQGMGNPGLVGQYLTYTWPRAVQSALQIALQRMDIIIVAALLSPSQAAIYALATRFIVLGQFAAQALQQVVAPHFSELFAKDLNDSAMRVARIVTVWTVLLVWPVYLFCITNGSALLRLLGGIPYESGAAALAILAAGMLFASMTGPVDTILLMAGRSAISLITTAVALAVDLALLFVLVPRMGINGAALAWCVALCVRSGLSLLFAKRTTGSSTFSASLAWAAGVTLLSFLLIPLSLAGLGFEGTSTTVAGLALSSAAYLVLLWTFRRQLGLSSLAALR